MSGAIVADKSRCRGEYFISGPIVLLQLYFPDVSKALRESEDILYFSSSERVNRLVIVSDYHKEMKARMDEGREVTPLFYEKDKAFARTLRMKKNLLGHFKKFKQYYEKKN